MLRTVSELAVSMSVEHTVALELSVSMSVEHSIRAVSEYEWWASRYET